MGAINFIVIPFYLLFFYFLAFVLRPFFTNPSTKKYFIPALTVKFFGALMLGLIYQFYYGGGDTIGFYFNGGSVIWDAFLDSPALAIKLMFANGTYEGPTYIYASKILAYHDLPTYFIVRLSGLFSLFTFNSYYGNALFFAVLSFSGCWALYYTFSRLYPSLIKQTAIIVFFIPSIIFWGSGILKDSITFSAVGWFFYGFIHLFIFNRVKFSNIIILIISTIILVHVKIYIALCLIPSMIVIVVLERKNRIRNNLLKSLVAPFAIVTSIVGSFLVLTYLGEINPNYSFSQFSQKSEISAKWLLYVSQQQGGAYYSLGDDDDFSQTGMIKKFVPAILTTLYRPLLWEVRNPVMLMSAIENFCIFLFTILVFYKKGILSTIKESFKNPFVLGFLIFTLLFAFAIGVSTYNFGSLVRYKIPMIPFFLMALLILLKGSSHKSTYG